MATRSYAISEARRRLSGLVERVARGGGPIGIGRYGRERAVLIGAEDYARLVSGSAKKPPKPPTLKGTLVLECSPEELIQESRRLGELWLAGIDAPTVRRSRRRR